MYPTTQKYKDNIYGNSRTTTGRVTFDISDTTAVGDVSSITTSPESPISVKAQLINKVRSSTYKTATLEQDRFALDGSFSFADDTIANNGELGWSSSAICMPDGVFRDNKIKNGDFSSGLTNWRTSGGGTFTTASGEAVMTASTQYADIDQLFAVTIGHRYYYRAKVKASSNLVSLLAGDYVTTSFTQTFHSGSNTYEYLSAILDIPSIAVPANFFFGVRDNRASGWTQVNFDEYMVVDLTETYGAGNEPTKAWCDSNLQFVVTSERPAITFNFSSNHSSAGLTITFDQLTVEYATDFDMTAYDASNAVIATTSVTGNTNVIATPLGQLYNYRKVSVIIRKWSTPNRRARVMEVDFGIVKQYTDDNLISMNLIEEMDLLTGKVPSAEFKFTVDNSAREFNILNPIGFYKYLQQKQQVIGEIGLDVGNGLIEYIPIGNYLLQEWQSNEGSLTATFTARTNLDNMSSFDYENLTATTKTLYQLAVDMFVLCGISNYSIDPALSSITTNALIQKTNCKDILQMIAIAGCANIYVTRDNKITLKCNPSTIGTAVDTATFDNMYQEPQIALDKPVKRVEVTYWANLSTSAIVGVNSTTDTLGDTIKLEKNTLINTSTQATAVANWMFAQIKYRATYKLNWRGNQALELNDIIDIENTYGGEMSAYITRNELDYAGYLQGRIEAKGVVN